MLTIRPCHIREAKEYVKEHHLALHCDDGKTLEILRCCTDGTYNACSKLYGAVCRIGFDMGYDRIITYTLESESGSSLRAAGFRFDGQAGGKQWTGSRRRDYYISPDELKCRWMKERRTDNAHT